MTASLPILQPAADVTAPVKGEREQALDDLWAEARQSLFRPKNFLTWLNLNRRFHLRFLRPERLKIEVPVGLLPDCENCVDICCVGPNAVVTLRLRDIAALVDAGLDGAIAPAATNPSELPKERAKSWAQRSLDASVFRQTFPVLKRDETGMCTLLDANRNCGAWPAWPLSCARYPYAVDIEHDVLFLAKGCESHRRLNADDAPDAIRALIATAVESYNSRVKDIILVHLALEPLVDLGLTRFLALPERLAKKVQRYEATRPHAISLDDTSDQTHNSSDGHR